jgi:stress-induced morphogen
LDKNANMSPDQMRSRLQECFPNAQVDVRDLTGGEDHYEVFIRSTAFKGLSRIDQHKKVMEAFAPELKTGEVHALSIRTETP